MLALEISPNTLATAMAERTLREHLRGAAKKRWAKATPEEIKAATSNAAKAYWAGKSAAEKSEIMKERARTRAKNARRKKRKR